LFLTQVDFVKSVDSVYKSLRLLWASVANSSKIDRAFESIFNVFFYSIVACVILSRLGFDPLALFISISGFILAFAFMIGSASSKYFEGLLFILVRRPFSIGDGITTSNVESETSFQGTAHWVVEDVNLFTTTVLNSWTNERATLSNGSLANSRIINMARSPQAYLYVYLKFGVDVPYSKLQIFHSALEQFIRDRPREWLSLCDFRTTRVEADLGYIEYIIVLQVRHPIHGALC
jgi:small-conductance mechanosensitive channel